MLLVNPPLVRFGQQTLEHVSLLAIDRLGARVAEEWTDLGPHAVFADVPEQRVQIRIVRSLIRDDLAAPRPGEQATLTFHTAPTGSDAARRRITASAVVTNITYRLETAKRAEQTITLTALSPDGHTDPITTTPDPS